MVDRSRRLFTLSFLILLLYAPAKAQFIKALGVVAGRGLIVTSYQAGDGTRIECKKSLPLFTFELNDTLVSSFAGTATSSGDSLIWWSQSGIGGSVRFEKSFDRGWKAVVTFLNTSIRKQQISNVVPLGVASDHVYIMSAGPQTYANRLSRSQLFRPGLGPIGVVLPDDAWEMGFCDVPVTPKRSLTAIARRTGSGKADERRFRTTLESGGFVQYVFYVDDHRGDWHEGLRMMFQDRWLYDLEKFDNTLFEREDLEWIRHSYLLVLQFAWDQTYYDAQKGRYGYYKFIPEEDKVLGGYDAYAIWPTWPRLGLDQRNQWDMYRDLPGGLAELRRQAEFMHKRGTRYFISYNPWDESTRHEDHIKGMERLLREIDADGVVLDTWGESSTEFQAAADRVKPGIILYSEGMAVPKDMPGIVAGRVHDAIYMPPPLNLNKLIKPEFAIFRVIQLAEGRIHREIAVSFFNGYGVELNVMRPGRPDWVGEEFPYLGRAIKILRENSSAFLSRDWVPLLLTTTDSIWVNKWPLSSKTLYTVYSLKPDGFTGPLFEVPSPRDSHYVSLWNHEELELVKLGGRTYAPVTVDGFSRSWLGTRREGNVDCVALLPNLLKVSLDQDSLHFEAARGKRVLVWAGMPSYSCRSAEFPAGDRTISLRESVGKHEEKFVVQLFEGSELLDERIVGVPLATPRLISRVERTPPASKAPQGMVEIPGGTFKFSTARSLLSPNEAIPYPDYAAARLIAVKKFYMDRYPVTNAQFHAFLKASHHKPKDPMNFLRHWVNGSPPKGLENHPVVYVSLEDAKAYARWAGKRLPTEVEWQYAAQGTDGRKYPWGNEFDSTKCNNGLGRTTPVDAFPGGKSPFGVMDLIGNVWQLTNDVYDDGSYYFGIIRGGSFFNPASSVWYIRGGPQPADNPQILLMVSPGFDRSATVGFRCVKDGTQ
jgi:formylglycine-generating enzyme required for sulfatase activity